MDVVGGVVAVDHLQLLIGAHRDNVGRVLATLLLKRDCLGRYIEASVP